MPGKEQFKGGFTLAYSVREYIPRGIEDMAPGAETPAGHIVFIVRKQRAKGKWNWVIKIQGCLQ